MKTYEVYIEMTNLKTLGLPGFSRTDKSRDIYFTCSELTGFMLFNIPWKRSHIADYKIPGYRESEFKMWSDRLKDGKASYIFGTRSDMTNFLEEEGLSEYAVY